MDEFIKQLSDYFTSSELIELLDVTTEDVVWAFLEKVEDVREDLEEIIHYGK